MAVSERGLQVLIVSGIFLTFATVVVLLRLWTRISVLRAPGADDAIIAASLVCTLAMMICVGIQCNLGLGRHGSTISRKDAESLLKAFWLSISLYCTSIGLTKTAILVQYKRVFATRTFQIWCWVAIGIIVTYTIVTIFTSIFICVPVSSFWTLEEGRCINRFASWFANAAVNLVTDLLIIILPMPMIRRLKLQRRQKIALMSIFAIGAIVCIISVIRLHSLLKISTSTDPTYDNAGAATWSLIELNVSLICACMPCLRPMFARWIPGSTSYARRTGASSQNNQCRMNRSSTKGYVGMSLQDIVHERAGIEELEGSDRIQVVTVIDMQIESASQNTKSERDGRDTSTESLVLNVKETYV